MTCLLSRANVLRYGPALLTSAGIAALSLAPAWLFREVERGLPPFPGFDKLVHAAMYAALTASGLHALPPAKRRNLSSVLAVAALAACYGAAMELAQRAFTNTRSMDPLDALANTAGALACALIVYAWSHRSRP